MGRFICITQLCVCEAVDADVECECIYAGGLGLLHVVVVVGGTRSIVHNANLFDSESMVSLMDWMIRTSEGAVIP